jgi:hypothetical protein
MNQIDRSVGFPVNVREMSELSECDSLKPKINSTIPRAKTANPMILFMLQHPVTGPSYHWGFSPK